MSVVDVFISNYPVINWDLYDLWVEGVTEREALVSIKDKTGSAGQLPRTADMLNSAGHTRWSALTRIYWMWWGTSLILDCRNGTELRANQKLSIRFYSHRRGSTDTFLLYLKLHLFQQT